MIILFFRNRHVSGSSELVRFLLAFRSRCQDSKQKENRKGNARKTRTVGGKEERVLYRRALSRGKCPRKKYAGGDSFSWRCRGRIRSDFVRSNRQDVV